VAWVARRAQTTGHTTAPADGLTLERRSEGALPPLTVTVSSDETAIAALRPDYARLELACANTSPFNCFEWQFSWCRQLLSGNRRVVDSPIFHVVREASGACVAIVPLIRTVRTVGRLRVTSIGMLGADPGITEIRSPMVHPGYSAPVAEIIDASLPATGEWDWIQWFGACDEFASNLGRRREFVWDPLPPAHVLDLRASWEEFRFHLKRNIRESLRHCYNSLYRAGHRFDFVIASKSHELPVALDRFLHLHRLRAVLKGTVEHADHFLSLQSRIFLREMCERFASRDSLRVFQIEIAGNIVASRLGFVIGDNLYLYYSGFDPRWASYGVMTTLVAEAIKYAISLGLRTVNLSPGTDVSKLRWGPRQVPYQTACERSARWRSRIILQAYQAACSAEPAPGWLRHMMPGRRDWR